MKTRREGGMKGEKEGGREGNEEEKNLLSETFQSENSLHVHEFSLDTKK